MAIDNLVQATVVTADGSVLTANDSENSDLFFGIRGGGCNFGVVTEFVLKLYPQRATIYSGKLVYKVSDWERIVETTAEWFPNAGENEGMMQLATLGPDRKPVIVVCPFYNGSEEEGRKNFKAFLDIGMFAQNTLA